MNPVRATLVVGNPRPGSRTMGVAEQVAKALCAGLRERGLDLAGPDVVDLAVLAAPLARRFLTTGPPDDLTATAYGQARRPGLLIVASPTFKGSYSGLLKTFMDLLPREGLGPGVVAVTVTTAGLERHRGQAEADLRELMVEVGADLPVAGLTVLESDFAALDLPLGRWLDAVTPVLAAVLGILSEAGQVSPPGTT